MLQELSELPDGLLDTDSRNLGDRLGAPTLLHLSGTREPALFVSVLLHGNETVGWEAIRALLKERLERFGGLKLPRSLSLFIGNVTAAACGVRRLPGQPDYNRVWPGSELAATLEHGLMARLVEIMSNRGVFASLDIHNNTGLNPHYACVNVIDNRFLHLATLFSRTVVYFIRPTGVQSMAMAKLCPSVTVECGKVGDAEGIRHAKQFIDAALHLKELPSHALPPQDIDIFHTVAQVKVPDNVAFGFTEDAVDLRLAPDLERMNFCELPGGTLFATSNGNGNGNGIIGLDVRDDHGRDVSKRFFSNDQGQLRLRQSVMPSMLTLDETVIRQDCLCYLMERYSSHIPSATEIG